jgi:flavin-dependent dehydrogenase
MAETDSHAIIIVGGGPAGVSAGLYLQQRAPELAARTLIIEAKEYPRPKLCGGGVTAHGEEQIRRLGLDIDIPAFSVQNMQFSLGPQAFGVIWDDAMRIFERAAFDAALARTAKERGLCIHTGERLLDLHPDDDGVTVITDQRRYRARVLIGADGANSTVRRKLKLFSTVGVARLLRVMTPLDPAASAAWQDGVAVFDFSCIRHGVQGYMWDFPCYVGDQPHMNRGIMDSRIAPQPLDASTRGNLKNAFAAGLADRVVDLDDVLLEGHPVRWFNPDAEFSRPHILLTGDAAGVDPLFAEGISYAMEYGEIITEMVIDAFARDDFAFTGYRERLLNHPLGKMLQRRTTIARYLYHYHQPHLWSVFWQLAAISPIWAKRSVGTALNLLPN